MEVNTEVEGSVFLMDEQHWSSVRGVGRMNKSNTDMFVNEFSEGNEFRLGKRVHGTNWRGSTFLQVDV